ncbi:MAG: hypothetical protein LC113_03300 [Acidobacteria bacterium]|nr:hypothetical protein [Acidobacteriota bacterium]
MSEFYIRKCIKLLGERWFLGIFTVRVVEKLDILTTDEGGSTELGRTLGFYRFASADSEPSIELAREAIYDGIPLVLRLTPVMVIRFGRILAHEVVHHRIRVLERQCDDSWEERLADRFARYFLFKLCRCPWYRFWRWILSDVAGWHHALGLADLKLGDSKKAQRRFRTAWSLDRENEAAAEAFWWTVGEHGDVGSELKNS